jgi:hypothetical protein
MCRATPNVLVMRPADGNEVHDRIVPPFAFFVLSFVRISFVWICPVLGGCFICACFMYLLLC